MKKWILIALAILIALPLTYKGYRIFKHEMALKQAGELYIGHPVPDATGVTTEGKTFSTTAQKGKNLIMVFWATWCRYCVAEIPAIKAFYEEVKKDPNLELISITIDKDPEVAKKFIREKKIPYPVIIDKRDAQGKGEFSHKFRIINLPSLWVIDKEGIIRGQNLHHLEEARKILKTLK